jgi:hypothetical protein
MPAKKTERQEWSMCTHFIPPREGLTWDDLCELWDRGAFTIADIKNIAPLYFEGAELCAVLDVIEKVENDEMKMSRKAA